MAPGSVMPSIACMNLSAAANSRLTVLVEGGPFPPPHRTTRALLADLAHRIVQTSDFSERVPLKSLHRIANVER